MKIHHFDHNDVIYHLMLFGEFDKNIKNKDQLSLVGAEDEAELGNKYGKSKNIY